MRKYSFIEALSLYGFQIFLLLALLFKINQINDSHKVSGILRMALPADDLDTSEFAKDWSGAATLNKWKNQNKKFITIYLTGDASEDNKRFDLIISETRKIMYTCDTNTIVNVHFNNKNTYGQFVGLINMMLEDHHKRYFYYKDDFYILGGCPELWQ